MNFNLSPNYSFHESLHHKSLVLKPQLKFYLHFGTQTQKKQWHRFWSLLYSAGTQHGNLHPAGWPILFWGPTQKLVLPTANTGKSQERFWKKCRWMDREGKNHQGSGEQRKQQHARAWASPFVSPTQGMTSPQSFLPPLFSNAPPTVSVTSSSYSP